MELEKALLNCEIKKTGDNEYEFIMSDETIDRDGEVILVDGWDLRNFKKNNILMFGHRHDIPGVGIVGSAVKEDGKLKAKKTRFASSGIYELADVVHGLVDDGVLKAVSVGYIPKEREYPAQNDEDKVGKKKQKPRILTKKAELYELSIVNVGSNPNALRAIKSAEDSAVKDFKGDEKQFLQDDEMKDFELDEKPYKNEHACRLKPPNYSKYARENCKAKSDGKCIDFIYGIKGSKESELQSMRYPKKAWSASAARAHCKKEGGTFEAAAEGDALTVEETEERFDEIKQSLGEIKEDLGKIRDEKEENKKGHLKAILDGDLKNQTNPPDKERKHPFAQPKGKKLFERK